MGLSQYTQTTHISPIANIAQALRLLKPANVSGSIRSLTAASINFAQIYR